MTILIPCPKCHGEGTLLVTVHEFGKPVTNEVRLTCVWCDGAGQITKAKRAEIEAQDAAWCHCDKPEHGGDHYTNPDIYCCRNCGGVLQTG
jgi:hypothetical protein